MPVPDLLVGIYGCSHSVKALTHSYDGSTDSLLEDRLAMDFKVEKTPYVEFTLTSNRE